MKTLLILPICVTVFGCAKEKVTIGRGEPQFEIQKCIKLSEKKLFEEAVQCLEVFKSKFPQTPYSTDAELSIADNYFGQKEYLLAAEAYKSFANLHPNSPKIDYAVYRLGLSYLGESPKAIDRDQQYLDDAIDYLGMVVVNFPNSPYRADAEISLRDARTRVAKRYFYIGNFYYKNGEYRAAIPRLLDVANDFGDTEIAPETLYKLVVSACELKRIEDAKTYYTRLMTDFPGSPFTEKAESKLSSAVKKDGNGGNQ